LLEFNPSLLPQGWVKEIAYRKTKYGIRTDMVNTKWKQKSLCFGWILFDILIITKNCAQYYTDPVSQYVFRTRRSALRYLETGKVTKRQFIQNTSVHDLYSFEKSADLVIDIPFYIILVILLTMVLLPIVTFSL
jgi:hypothetical protein